MINLKLYIRQQRIRAGYTLRDLADITSISKSTLSNYERGITYPRLVELEIIAKALGCSLQDLFVEI